MTVRYMGIGGNDANDGLSWANRKLTMSGASGVESTVAAGDTVYVGPGTYRETFTTATAGSSGNIITYIADIYGHNTDGIGGYVRVTGSDDDTTATRQNSISSGHAYRTWRGFDCDSTVNHGIYINAADNIVEDCTVQGVAASGIWLNGAGDNKIVRRCIVTAKWQNSGIVFSHTSTVALTGSLVENCIVFASYMGINSQRVSGHTIKNCIVTGCNYAIRVQTALAASESIIVTNCLVFNANISFGTLAADNFTESYNSFWGCNLFYSGTEFTINENSNNNIGLFDMTKYASAFQPYGHAHIFYPHPQNILNRITGTSAASEDYYGFTRPATASKLTRGPIQYMGEARSTTQTYDSSTASLKLPDAGRVQITVPFSSATGNPTISVRVYREADYAGTNPQIVIKQPGNTDVTVTDAAAASQWNELTDDIALNASPKWFVVEMVSNNTATTGSYGVYFDALTVT